MISDVFWTGFFTFAGGVVGAIGGYVGVRNQRSVQQSQLELERARYEADQTHRGIEERDAAREKRRWLYLKYIETGDAVLHATVDSELTVDALGGLWAKFVQVSGELDLGAVDEVVETVPALHNALQAIMQTYMDVLAEDGRSWPRDALSWLHAEEQAYEPAREQAVSVMRDDLHGKTPAAK